jgi:DNA invertase Pin-like site-specific DNA recombinase
MNPESFKIGSEHLERSAYIYVRQSTYYQVEHHRESQARQYNLVQYANDLGWPAERIVVVDEDQGKSGANPHVRSGFGRVVTAVGRAEVGIVMSLEASRLARNSPDWHSLIYMCRYTNTLIADEHGIYDPTSSTDRMVLGIRGQMSEIELDTSIHRMIEGRWNKARRGEPLVVPPAGYEIDDLNQLVFTNDEAVANAIRTVFCKLDELQCAKRVYTWWREEGLQFPARRIELRSHPIVWVTPSYRAVLYVLHNPIYAGAYVLGRSRTVKELDPDDPRKIRTRHVKNENWPVLIKDHHPAYISFETFERNQEIIRSNQTMKRYTHEAHRGPVREGPALLQGLVRCGQCGRRMNVSYGGSRPSPTTTRTLQYRCSVARTVHEVEGKDCQIMGGKRIDAIVVEALLRVTRDAGTEAALLAREQLEHDHEQAERAWQLQVEKAAYEAERAERQFNAVEPENRLVARTLEARWNACLKEVEDLRAKAQGHRQERRPLTELELQRAKRLGDDLARVWHASTTSDRDRKRLLRATIEEVQLRTEDQQYEVKIVWKGGATTVHRVQRYRRTGEHPWHTTSDSTLDMIRKLAAEFDDRQIANILNKQNRRTGEGNPFTAHKVATHRNRHGIPNCPKRTPCDPHEGPFTADEAAAELGVTSSTIHRWLRDGILPGKQLAAGAPWRILLPDELRSRLTRGAAPAGWLGLTAAAQELGMSKPRVAYLVKAGKLPAMRVVVAKRPCWRIDVSSASCGPQAKLFDPMTTVVPEEA